MNKTKLGNTDIYITQIGAGTWALGGDNWAWGWGDQDPTVSRETLLKWVESGVNWFDTAALYGLGFCEELIGDVLREIGPTNRPMIFTKCSLVWDEESQVKHDLSAKSIRAETEASLKRLKIDVIDVQQIHWPAYPPGSEEDGSIVEAVHELNELKKEGKIRAVGVSNFSAEQTKRVLAETDIDVVQPRYSLLHQDPEYDLFPLCEAKGLGVIVYSPLHSGFLARSISMERMRQLPTSDMRKSKHPEFQGDKLVANLETVAQLSEVCQVNGLELPACAINWVLKQPAVSGAIVGARTPEQATKNANSQNCELPEDLYRSLTEISQAHGARDFV